MSKTIDEGADLPAGFSAAKLRGSSAFKKRQPTSATRAAPQTYTIEGKSYRMFEVFKVAVRRKATVNEDTIRKRVLAGKRTWKELLAPASRNTQTAPGLGLRKFAKKVTR